MTIRILVGDVLARLRQLPDNSVHCCVTSPPYWGLRSYLPDGHPDKTKEIGCEPTLAQHLDVMVNQVFAEVWRVLRPDGTCWVNYGDCYATSPNGRRADEVKRLGRDDRTFRDKPFSTIQGSMKPKDLCMVPNRFAIAMQDYGWWVRSEIVWHKPNPMPESISDRPATAHEKMFLFTKSERYFYDATAVRTEAKGRGTDFKMPDVGIPALVAMGLSIRWGERRARSWTSSAAMAAVMRASMIDGMNYPSKNRCLAVPI